MFNYIKGTIEEIGIDYIVVECNGIGYQINTSQNTISNFKNGDIAKIYTKLIVKEDDISICGFSTQDELKLFLQLITVSKVGPKVAMSVLSSYDYKNVISYIIGEDVNKISKSQGVGKKTAERIILELKDKVDKSMAVFETNLLNQNKPKNTNLNVQKEALEALLALGYSSVEAKDAISKSDKNSSNVEALIKNSLKYLMK